MGGDGGVIPKSRRYLRGAGASDKTGNDGGSHDRNASVDPTLIKEEQGRAMRVCAISNQPLRLTKTHTGVESKDAVVVCPYGRLYIKEAIVEALLGQRTKKTKDARLDHIRGLKDLHVVRFHYGRSSTTNGDGELVPTCPVRGTELNGLIPALVLVPGSPGVSNVLSVRAIQEMGEEAIEQEYGPAERRIKLLPYGDELVAVKQEHELVMRAAQKKRNHGKKRKHIESIAEQEERRTHLLNLKNT